jgi:hypothetical protein
MVGVAAPQRAVPFDAAPAPLAIAPSPPPTSAPGRGPTASVRAVAAPSPAPAARGGGAALARTIAAPAPTRAPSVRPSVAPAAGRPARSLTPTQALDLPPPTPPPVLKTPPPAMVMPLGADADSEPTRVNQPTSQPAEASEPVLVFPEPEPIIDSITMTADAEPSVPVPAPAMARTPLAPIGQSRRRLALLGIGMGVAIVAVAVIGVKLLRRPKTTASAPVAIEVVKSGPDVEPVAPSLDVPTAAQPGPARGADGVATRKPAARKATAKAETNREAPVVAKHDANSSHRRERSHKAKAQHGGARHARKVGRHDAAAKASAPTVAADHADPRPLYEKGNALLFSGDAKGAIAAYREAVHEAPSDPIGFRGLGLAYELQGETVPAIKALRRYLKLAPDAPDRAIIHRRIDRLRARK